MSSILIVEDDITFSTMLRTWLIKKGFKVNSASTVAAAVKTLLDNDGVDMVLSDLRLPDHDGLFLLEWMQKRGFSIPFVVMTNYAEVQNAVQAMKSGASDYIAKPVHPDVLLQKIKDALKASGSDTGKVSVEVKPADSTSVKSSAKEKKFLDGTGTASRRLYDYVALVAPTPMSVLILGSSGTGKEHVAHRIHDCSRRTGRPFVAIDCGAVPRDMAASEFFGHVKGAFTGAISDKRGAFVEADGGTLFLDEVGNLSYDVQVQMLRALQEHRIRPVGADYEVEVDFRLICATNENLAEAVDNGTFREDLYHRINEFTIRMPDLKERGSDLFLFADFFLEQANRELERNILGFDAKASELMAKYSWPGNLRELRNVVKRAVLVSTADRIRPEDLNIQITSSTLSVRPLYDEESELSHIREALSTAGGNKSKAARLLGIDRKTLYNKLDKYGINH
ncbi:sigma-54-dependent Fis family transcriptional regulator [Prevotella sp. PMUR]|uniref:Sigma-54-dependent Fis family transcriptional regulator n=2 Tax=Xylanibacter muris TaxID=2736290 RepID=A0ABX2AL68_9BACT|nr:sigma-54 dependent transcriptional regulator [Xylanibacter muris]NPD90787.1 sigma-54-dependent Fis family transcriptional regulator [Xylanibacter muris]